MMALKRLSTKSRSKTMDISQIIQSVKVKTRCRFGAYILNFAKNYNYQVFHFPAEECL